MLFWIIALALSAVVAIALAAPLRRGPASTGTDPDMAFYRAQIAEIETDRARGLIGEEEAERARAEIGRRLLAADKDVRQAPAAGRGPMLPALLFGALVVIGGAMVLYTDLGAPGLPDRPLAERLAEARELSAARPSQAQAEAVAPPLPVDAPEEYVEMVEKLRAAVPERPDDLTGWQLLARHEAALGDYAAAARAQERVIEIKGADAGFEDRMALVDRLVAAAGGIVTSESEALLRELRAARPDAAGPLYYLGLLQAQIERPDLAFRFWRRAIETGDPASPHVELARAQIGRAAQFAGVDYTPPPVSGPTAEEVAAAQNMEPEARQEMIRSMVENLASRLAESGGPASDWARLIRALGVLGEATRAEAIWGEAQQVFAGDPALEEIRAAAQAAGVTR
ncbi:c-type cytochrome biogenesis protein CcmI [Limimaricola variabilis]|uniref:c-type cytochrome biogenesis protein CcmI n=1 Tax=Limimaricola variabilis TaxID=1492771 RepID=UPI002AC97EF6|nr:c-type cytochrome biogenesis protein CcmI [Limimaricola variabilis]WPY95567.1 c-type cytochrome biogenesis protein CcmI [Limimaricola variabilis]